MNSLRSQKAELLQSLPGLEGKDKLVVLNKLVFVYTMDKPDSGVILSHRAVELADSLNIKDLLADAYRNLATAYFMIDSIKLSVTNYLNALRIYETLGPSVGLGFTYENLCLLNWMVGRTEEALEYNRKEVQVFNELPGFWRMQFYGLIGLGMLYESIQQYDSSEYSINKAFDIVKSQGDTNYLLLGYFRISSIKLKLGLEHPDEPEDLIECITYSFKVLDLLDLTQYGNKSNIGKSIFLLIIYQRLSEAFMALGTDSADITGRDYLNKARYIADTIDYTVENKIDIYKILAAEQSGTGNYREAIRLYKKGIESQDLDRITNLAMLTTEGSPQYYFNKIFAVSNYKKKLQSIYDSLYVNHKRLGNYMQALKYNELKEETANEIFSQDKQNLVKTLEARSEQEKIEKQMAILVKDKEINALKVTQSRYYIYGILAFLFLVLVLGFLFIRVRKFRLEQKALLREKQLHYDLELKELESSKLKEVDKIKSRFFANISHEFRTPLTLILGPLDSLKSHINDPDTAKEIDTIRRNAQRLQNLINQLLDLSQLESGKMKLQAGEEDIVRLSRTYAQSFKSLAKTRNIKLEFNSSDESINIFIDRDKFEKILFNLLSNAFKATDKGGRIAVSVGRENSGNRSLVNGYRPENIVNISVSDTGSGIDNDKLPHIFDRFYQAGDNGNNYQEGSGIGLALVKDLVELHHGSIEVESEPGEGTIFRIYFPLGRKHLKPHEIVQKPENSPAHSELFDPVSIDLIPLSDIRDPEYNESITKSQEEKDELPLVLIVEDNEDMRHYIREHISGDFRLIEVADGKKGLEKAIETIPDLVITDVMMPRMDGMELCTILKTDQRTSHIPVIMLTAKAAPEDRLDGLNTGADDFLTKPFNRQELLVRVKNLILQRKNLQEKFQMNAMNLGLLKILGLPECGISSTDKVFLMKAIEVVNEHISDEEFTTEMLHQEMSMTYMQLYRKLKSLLGKSVSGFIRQIRLNHAAELIKAQAGTITEIAFQVGFNSPSYFSQCFEQEFGVLPSQYHQHQGE